MIDKKKKISKKVLNPNPSTAEEPVAKYVHFDDWTNMNTQERCHMSVAGVERLTKELIDWAMNNDLALKLNQFYAKKGMNSHTIDRWEEMSPGLKDAIAYAKRVIGDRREVGGMFRKYEAGLIKSSMSFYDKDWKQESERLAALSNKNDDKTKAREVFVVMDNLGYEKIKKDDITGSVEQLSIEKERDDKRSNVQANV